MKSSTAAVRLPSRDEPIAPVTIFDAEGRIVRVIPAAEFHRATPAPRIHRFERRRRVSKLAGVGPEE